MRPDAGEPGGQDVPSEQIGAMVSAMSHRGPDGHGSFHGPGLAIGHRRLAVIDLEGGAQPMALAEQGVVVSLNGEIYNHAELRKELEARGRRFRTRSDTEVLLHAHVVWGDSLVGRLRGMYAFALWDARRRQLSLARDPLGQKPLYYAHLADGSLVFASELGALARHPDVQTHVDPESLAGYLTAEYVPHERCIFAGVRKLLPGHLLFWRRGTVRQRRMYRIPMGDPAPCGNLERGLLDRLDVAVDRCMVSDVPVGVFLSGGIDSSAVLASVVRRRDPKSVQTFSIGFEDSAFDESAAARRVAAFFDTAHHERILTSAEVLARIPRVMARLDEPFGDPSFVPTHLLCELAREHVKVALGGDGSDELLYGYATFQADPVARAYAHLPALLRAACRRALSLLPAGSGYMSPGFVARRFFLTADAAPEERHPRWLSSVLPGHRDDPLHSELRAEFPVGQVLRAAVEAYFEAGDVSHLDRVSYQYATTYLPGDILYKIDRASMANSLEVRSPFLEVELVSFLARLPPHQKMDWRGRTKLLLRRAMSGRLPIEVLRAKKHGFAMPVQSWLRGPLRELLETFLSPERVAAGGYFDPSVVERLKREHQRGFRDHRKLLWTLLCFELWREHHAIGAR